MSADELHLGAQAGLVLVLFFFAAGFVVYARLAERLSRLGGRVVTTGLDLPDLLVSFVLMSALGGLALSAALQSPDPESSVDAKQAVQNGVFFLVMALGIVIFLRVRGLHLTTLFGLRSVGILPAIGWAFLLLLAAFPFIAGVNALTAMVLEGQVVRQPMVEFFREAAVRGDYPAMASVGFAAVLVAPLCEEFFFRGYFYGVGKRYLGPWFSGAMTALLFAAIHGNLAALPSLFLLAVALTLAYERTGSLFVPIGMHALFNATSLGVLYAQGTGLLPS